MWDKLSKNRFPYADFATYPRGRLLFDVKRGQYLLYLDRCITDEETKKLIKFYGLEKDLYILSRDEHYSCDKCCRISQLDKTGEKQMAIIQTTLEEIKA